MHQVYKSQTIEPRFAGGKTYRPRVQLSMRLYHCRKSFQRASEAERYAKRVIATWCREYDRAAALALKPEPAQP